MKITADNKKNKSGIEKIKVVHIISNLSLGGAQVLLFDILSNLKSYYDMEITVITIDSGFYVRKFQDEGITVIDIKEKGLINFRILSKIKQELKKIKPDIVHTHLNKADFYGRIAARLSKVPVIFSTCHNYSTNHSGADINKRTVLDRVDNCVISYSKSNLIAISEIVKKYLINRNSKLENITEVVYNGVNIEKAEYKLKEIDMINFRNELGISKDDFVISILGRLDLQKGHQFFLDAIGDFLKEKKNVKVLIVGDGNLKNKIADRIREKELQNFVIITGFQTETEKFIEISDLICVPSLWEGFGLVVIEGMIKGKIVLASNVGGIPEIIEDGKTGFLFEVNNRESFLEKINLIYDSYNDLDAIRVNALELVKIKFDIHKNSELYYKAYLNKLNGDF